MALRCAPICTTRLTSASSVTNELWESLSACGNRRSSTPEEVPGHPVRGTAPSVHPEMLALCRGFSTPADAVGGPAVVHAFIDALVQAVGGRECRRTGWVGRSGGR